MLEYASLILVVSTLGIVGIALFNRRSSEHKEEKISEPPWASTSIPYIGHVIGLMQNKFNYYVQLRYASFIALLQAGDPRHSH